MFDTFTTQYIETMRWSSLDDNEKEYTQELALETKIKIERDCAKFQLIAESMLSDDYSQAGHDFWLTRNGHGAGFWDGDWPECGGALTALSEMFGEVTLYLGDDNLLYLS